MKCALKHREREAVKEESVKQTVNFMLMAFATYLGDKRGWKPERIVEALKWIEKEALMIRDEYTTYEEAKQALKDDYGLVFTDDGVMIEYGKNRLD